MQAFGAVFYTKTTIYTAKREEVTAFKEKKEEKRNGFASHGEPIQKNDGSRPSGTEAALFAYRVLIVLFFKGFFLNQKK